MNMKTILLITSIIAINPAISAVSSVNFCTPETFDPMFRNAECVIKTEVKGKDCYVTATGCVLHINEKPYKLNPLDGTFPNNKFLKNMHIEIHTKDLGNDKMTVLYGLVVDQE